ncbi:hypothetical protein E4665_16355 [Sporolactobacillus shoreae]|uniref:Uncharacterized protein n=1 Tax=Sporolactobacillus shoreae TaxID=1465501 RepID=A0A4Z0GHI1_9BACL|nr:hypothetical protein [Sporolactobacillus shoreae]TGA96170.1 hypothetical protein E4665_16355 [Sporolactobacillus shoreae]
MISGSLLLLYSLINLISGAAVWHKIKMKNVLAFYLAAHLLCGITGALMIGHLISEPYFIITLCLALVSRFLNGFFLFHHVHIMHHIMTATFFLVILLIGY